MRTSPPKATLAILTAGSLLAAVLAGCGADDTPPSPAGTGDKPSPTSTGGSLLPKPCELLTRDEAAEAAGNPVDEGKMLGVVCVWQASDLDEDSHVQVSVAYVPSAGNDPEEMCQSSLAGIPGAKPLPGVGNKAYWSFSKGGISSTGSLHVCVDRGFIDTSAIGGRSEADLQKIAVSLANTVQGRL